MAKLVGPDQSKRRLNGHAAVRAILTGRTYTPKLLISRLRQIEMDDLNQRFGLVRWRCPKWTGREVCACVWTATQRIQSDTLFFLV
jgi:hypothetical protein